MKKDALTAALAVTLVAAPLANAAENPFQSDGFAGGYMVAAEGRDMAGNPVMMPENFTYGGDNMGAYAGGKIGTGAKDPAVCGTFANASCSITYTKK